MKDLKIGLRVLLFSLVVVLGLSPSLAYAQQAEPGHPLKVMTRNLYQGTDYQEVIGYGGLEFFARVDLLVDDILAGKPEARMHAVAMEIAAEQPDIVALQEATTWYVGTMDPMQYGPTINMLQLLTDDLRAMGSPYQVAIAQDGFGIGAKEGQLPPIPSAQGRLVGTNMQLVILVREDMLKSGFVIEKAEGGVFTHYMTMPVLGMDLPVLRTWAYIDVSEKGRKFRFITLHPEAFSPEMMALQMDELLAGAANTNVPVVMAADFNLWANLVPPNAMPSDPNPFISTYAKLTAAGYVDAWPLLYPNRNGWTCCQAENLLNDTSTLDHRIDLIFTKGAIPYGAKVVGGKTTDMIEGVWPSDHAGLVGKVKIQ